jgi:4-amino-4-deoxy-L-arabinose transferase-like glycosyltransferase
LLLIPVSLAMMGWFSFVALHRFIDGDEGYYVLASRLVLLHKTPYLDFLYQQAPLLPYIYGGWMKLAGVSWTSARIFSALLTTILGALIYTQVCRETGKWAAGLAAAALFASATFVFAWFPLVKTFSLAALLLFGAYAIVSRLSAASPRWLIAAGGLLFGLRKVESLVSYGSSAAVSSASFHPFISLPLPRTSFCSTIWGSMRCGRLRGCLEHGDGSCI